MTGKAQLICDFCSWPDPTVVYPCRDYDTGLPADGVSGATAGSLGEWLACEACAEFIRRAQRSQLARHCARMLRKRKPEQFRMVSLNVLERAIDGSLSDFWAHREGEPHEITEDDRARFLAMPDRELMAVPGPARPVPGWAKDLLEEVQHGR